MIGQSKARVTLTDGMGRRRVYEEFVDPTDRTLGVAAQDIISGLCLTDSDSLLVEFIHPTEKEPE